MVSEDSASPDTPTLMGTVRPADGRPLPRRVGLTHITSDWGMNERHGKNALNTVQPQLRQFSDRFGGFRLARPLMEGA